jgi:deoxyribodipyrimidine photolyase-like uncharacterized protein
MTPSEIIIQEAQKIGYDADVLLRKIDKLVQSKAAILLQKNDTLLLLIGIAEYVAEAHVFTIDSPVRVIEAIKYFAEEIKKAEIKKIYFDSNPKQEAELQKTLQVLKGLKLKVQKSNVKPYDWVVTA